MTDEMRNKIYDQRERELKLQAKKNLSYKPLLFWVERIVCSVIVNLLMRFIK